ncbi:MAG: hypothetical protein ACR2QE_05670 [Acidimicrobiales bacterium]
MSDHPAWAPWSVRAVNLPEHADNIVHTDEGARAAGYPAALVAGTTVYAYLTHLPAEQWGPPWLEGGGSEVRFKSPVYDDDLVECRRTDGDVIEARVGDSVRATLAVTPHARPPGALEGDRLPAMTAALDGELAGYGLRAGDDLDVYDTEGLAHPAVWPVIGNRVMIANLVDGPWIHVRSKVVHLGRAPRGADITIDTAVIDRFTSRAGERVVIDVRVGVDGRPLAAIEHESIVRLTDPGLPDDARRS